jgi:hypothetical protein
VCFPVTERNLLTSPYSKEKYAASPKNRFLQGSETESVSSHRTRKLYLSETTIKIYTRFVLGFNASRECRHKTADRFQNYFDSHPKLQMPIRNFVSVKLCENKMDNLDKIELAMQQLY